MNALLILYILYLCLLLSMNALCILYILYLCLLLSMNALLILYILYLCLFLSMNALLILYILYICILYLESYLLRDEQIRNSIIYHNSSSVLQISIYPRPTSTCLNLKFKFLTMYACYKEEKIFGS